MSNATWSSLNEKACFTRDSRTNEWDCYMSRPAAPSMPTAKQVREARDLVLSIDPNAKILRVGPDGVTFSYDRGGPTGPMKSWAGKPFSAEDDDE